MSFREIWNGPSFMERKRANRWGRLDNLEKRKDKKTKKHYKEHYNKNWDKDLWD